MNKTYLIKSFLPGILVFVLALMGQILTKVPLKSYSWILYLCAVILFVYVFRHISVSQLSLEAKGSVGQHSYLKHMPFDLLGFSVITTVLSFVLFNVAFNWGNIPLPAMQVIKIHS